MTKTIHKIALICITILMLINVTAGRQRVLLADASKEVHGSVAERVQIIDSFYSAFSATTFSDKGSTKIVSRILGTEGKPKVLVTNSGFTDAPPGTSVTAVAEQIREAFPKPIGGTAAGAGEGSEGLKIHGELSTEQVLTEHLQSHGFDFSAYDAKKVLDEMNGEMQKAGSSASKKGIIDKSIAKYKKLEKGIVNLHDAASDVYKVLNRFVTEEAGVPAEAEVSPLPKIISAPFSSYEVAELQTALVELEKGRKALGLNKKTSQVLEELRFIQELQYKHDAYHDLKAGSGGAAAVDPTKAEEAKAKLMTCYYGSCAEDALLHKVLHDLSSKLEGSPKILRVEIYGPMDPCHQCQVKLEWLADKLAEQYEEAALRSRVEVCYFSKKGYPQSPCMVRDTAEEEEPLTSLRDASEEGQLMMYRYFSEH